MKYQVRATRLERGRYQFSYGRGGKQLTDIAVRRRLLWIIIGREDICAGSLGKLKRSWGDWARRTYDTIGRVEPDPCSACVPGRVSLDGARPDQLAELMRLVLDPRSRFVVRADRGRGKVLSQHITRGAADSAVPGCGDLTAKVQPVDDLVPLLERAALLGEEVDHVHA